MAKHTYRVLTDEGATFAQRDAGIDAEPIAVDADVELDLDVNTKRAVLAAGWLEQTDDASTLEALTVAELDDRYGDLDGYPHSGTKADKVEFITKGGNA